MSDGARRIAMWSGPRNLSTALMRSFAQRADTAVWDEPFYAAFLSASGADHPLRAEIIAAYERNPERVAAACLGPPPAPANVFYQKHMTHHMLADFPRDWTAGVTNAFLIRRPEAVVASYRRKRESPTLDDLGFLRQRDLFDAIAERTGAPPPVVDADALRRDPEATLTKLCAALAIPFDRAMLAWPAGPRASDGLWAAHWYDAVERSTGFTPPPPVPALDTAGRALADAARPAYEALARHAL
ncbi:MAG: HAD family hydrolase [Alphaproteobacteria bacterium]